MEWVILMNVSDEVCEKDESINWSPCNTDSLVQCKSSFHSQ